MANQTFLTAPTEIVYLYSLSKFQPLTRKYIKCKSDTDTNFLFLVLGGGDG
ncbi:unnamed protein product [Sphenostylis stenocarpa]|uniref:Uncharacterized protein n=1 Tax=Sphenostylis stenocarpa TaxID=92480 RepID=A0AA86SNX9_9FABA|nr:unnamed protein product [Sphenostylis stenocarpa]